MGSGRGITKRAKSTASTNPANIGGYHAWNRFTKNNALSSKTLCSYYLGYDDGLLKFTKEELRQVATELFRDLLEIGALTIPKNRTANDYNVEIKPPHESTTDGPCILLSRGTKARSLVLRSPEQWLDKHTPLAHYNIEHLWNCFQKAIISVC